jgi:hypothetical protein
MGPAAPPSPTLWPGVFERPTFLGHRPRGSLAACVLAELAPPGTARPAPPRRPPFARLAPDPSRTRHVSDTPAAWSDDPRELCLSCRLAHAVATAPPRAGVRAPFPTSVRVFAESDERAWRSAGAQGLLLDDPTTLAASLSRPAPLAARRGTEDALLLALADHPSHIDARLLMYVASLLAVDGRATTLAVPAGARDIPAARRYRRGFDLPLRLLELTGQIAPAIAAADAVLLCTPEASPAEPPTGGIALLRALACAWGVPVVPIPSVERLRRDARRLVAPLFDVLDHSRAPA